MIRYPLLLSLLLATPCLAQLDPDPNGIGLYFDEGATQIARDAAPGEEVTVYLIITNPSAAGALVAWDLMVHTDNACLWGEPLSGGNGDMNMPPCGPNFSFWVVDYPHPDIVMQPVTVVATITVSQYDDSAPVPFFIYPRDNSLSYMLDGPGGPRVVLTPISGSFDRPVAVLNGSAPVAAESAAWGAVKSLNR